MKEDNINLNHLLRKYIAHHIIFYKHQDSDVVRTMNVNQVTVELINQIIEPVSFNKWLECLNTHKGDELKKFDQLVKMGLVIVKRVEN